MGPSSMTSDLSQNDSTIKDEAEPKADLIYRSMKAREDCLDTMLKATMNQDRLKESMKEVRISIREASQTIQKAKLLVLMGERQLNGAKEHRETPSNVERSSKKKGEVV